MGNGYELEYNHIPADVAYEHGIEYPYPDEGQPQEYPLDRWVPDVPRPSIEEDLGLMADFLANWILREMDIYLSDEIDKDDITVEDVKQTQLFCDILNDWDWDDAKAAEELIRHRNWDFHKAKCLIDGDLLAKADEYDRELSRKWVAENGYQPPFERDIRVRWKNYGVQREGVIGVTVDKFLSAGLYTVQTPDCIEIEESIMKHRSDHIPGSWGEKVRWEDLEVIYD